MPRPSWSDQSIAVVRSLRSEGFSWGVIASKFEVEVSTVRKALRRADELPIRAWHREFDDNAAAARASTGRHLRDIYKAHGYNAKWASVNIGNDCITRHVPAHYSYVPPSGGAALAMPRSGRGGSS